MRLLGLFSRLVTLAVTAVLTSTLSVVAQDVASSTATAAAFPGIPASVTSQNTTLNGFNVHYFLGVPSNGTIRGTIFLIHGWPDLAYGWRNQFQTLMDLGLRVVAMDSIGYGQTDAPENLNAYSFKQAAQNVKAMADQLGIDKIILGGHDWGGPTAYRVYQYFPNLVSHLFTIAVPYIPVSPVFIPLSIITATNPNLRYQTQLSSGIVEKTFITKPQLRNFINTIYEGKTASGLPGFDLKKGFLFKRVDQVQKTRLLSDAEIDTYVNEYSRHGLKGPCNWYRTLKVNWDNDRSLKTGRIEIPALYINAAKSALISESTIASQSMMIPNFTSRSLNTDHWVMIEDPQGVNSLIKEWIEKVVFGRNGRM